MQKTSAVLLLFLLSLASLSTGCTPEPRAVAPPVADVEAGGAVLQALREPDVFVRIQQLSQLLPNLGPAAVPEIADALRNPSVDLGGAEIALLTRAWALHDPAAAVNWASMSPPLGLRLSALLPAVELWAKQDPLKALKGIGPMMVIPGLNTRALQIALVRGWFDSGTPGLVEYIRDLGMGYERQRALAAYSRRLIQRNGVEAGMRWAESLPDEPQKFKLNAFRQLASELAQHDPAAGVAWCEAHCAGPFGSGMPMMVGIRWAVQDAPAALGWLSGTPEGKERDRAVRDAYRRWTQVDRAEAEAWVEAIGPENAEPWFGAVAEVHAQFVSQEDPRKALVWVESVSDPARREQAYVRIARAWRETDESAAEAWLVQSPLLQEARERVRQPVERNIPAGFRNRKVKIPAK
jgi:hypothetical protein